MVKLKGKSSETIIPSAPLPHSQRQLPAATVSIAQGGGAWNKVA